jgi:hypothetical protein
MNSTAIAALFLVLLSVPGAMAAPRAPVPAKSLPLPQHVSAQTRQEMKTRMGQHAATMQNLVRAVVLLDRPTIRVLATRIADEEIVARMTTGREAPRPLLPPRFFTDQDELTASARQLAVAAIDGGDDNTLADRFAAVTRTCVSCHSSYLHDRPEPPPPAAGAR